MKQIELSQGKYAIVDDADYEWLAQWKWSFGGKKYAVRRDCSNGLPGIVIYMHRAILGITGRAIGHHKNGDGLDNRRSNLAECTRQWHRAHHAGMGRREPWGKTSMYKGVRKGKGGRWITAYDNSYVRTSNTEEEAAALYNEAASKSSRPDEFLNPVSPGQVDVARDAYTILQEAESREYEQSQTTFFSLLRTHSQRELADKLQVSEAMISRIRSGQRKIGIQMQSLLLTKAAN